jgi:hypothetical protein
MGALARTHDALHPSIFVIRPPSNFAITLTTVAFTSPEKRHEAISTETR